MNPCTRAFALTVALTVALAAPFTGASAAELSVRLLDLELDGHVARLPGQLFQRQPRD